MARIDQDGPSNGKAALSLLLLQWNLGNPVFKWSPHLTDLVLWFSHCAERRLFCVRMECATFEITDYDYSPVWSFFLMRLGLWRAGFLGLVCVSLQHSLLQFLLSRVKILTPRLADLMKKQEKIKIIAGHSNSLL